MYTQFYHESCCILLSRANARVELYPQEKITNQPVVIGSFAKNFLDIWILTPTMKSLSLVDFKIDYVNAKIDIDIIQL